MVKIEQIKKKLDFVRRFPITVTIIMVCVVIFIVNNFIFDKNNYILIYKYFGLVENTIKNKEYYRLLTCFFIHFDINHLVGNMFILLLMGHRVEEVVGKLRFLLIYLFSGIVGSILEIIFITNFRVYNNYVSAGASGAIFGIIGASIVLILLDSKKKIDISKKGIVFLAVFLLLIGKTTKTTNINNIGHITGLLSGLFITMLLYFVEKIIKKNSVISKRYKFIF
ncbi:rhomboid family intramembrane serine protease [Lachnobacterium bovis]|uniref:Rhomboid protease GluP n=1 Tax=Lachnobacterium bovis TaxID=140626 RepID=A0A1H9SWC3_9FIRM|nr:rhomboid family intramembrane serine protease [Lachnobacterium bovis]SER89147.1 rhomboid protease GluP [Lachnobacterium bovis]